MKINVAKCQTVGISSRRNRQVFDPNLLIGDQTIPFIGSSVFKFFSLRFDMRLSDHIVRNNLLGWLDSVSDSELFQNLLRRQQKLKIYPLCVCPGIS